MNTRYAHTYSHILADRCDEDTVKNELDATRSLHDNYGLDPPTSIVMPRHHDVNYSTLSEYGIDTVRRPIKNYHTDTNNRLVSLWQLLTREHPECEINIKDDILETTCVPHPTLSSMLLPVGQEKQNQYLRILPQRLREKRHERYLINAFRKASENDCHIHLWSHLYNISNNSQWRATATALNYLGRLTTKKDIEIKRMCDLSRLK